jgi:lysophospholipase L1-like esterase
MLQLQKSKYFMFSTLAVLLFFLLTELCFNIYAHFAWGTTGFPFNRFIKNRLSSKTSEEERTGVHVWGVPWDYVKKKMRPGKYVTDKGIRYTVNSLGFRGKEFDPFNKTKYRIICFGGSSTLGLGSPEDKTYPAVLEKLLNDSGIEAEVLNFGFASKGLEFIVKLLYREGFSYRPDLISIYSNRNTVLYDSNRARKPPELIRNRFDYYLFRLNCILYDNYMTYRSLSRKIARFRRKLNNELATPKHNSAYVVGRELNETFFENTYPKTLERIILAGRALNIKVCLIKQPLYRDPSLQLEIKDYPVDRLWNMLKDENNVDHFSSEDDKYWILTSSILNRQMDILKDKYDDVIVVDPLAVFLEESVDHDALFFDYIHLRPAGNELLVEQIFSAIRPTFVNEHSGRLQKAKTAN